MKTEFCTICDFAQNNNGKITLVGVFDRLVAKTLPAHAPALYAVLRTVDFGKESLGKKKVTVSLLGPEDAQVVPDIESEVEMVRTKSSKLSHLNLIVGLNGLRLDKHGIYKVKFDLEDFSEYVAFEVLPER